MLAQLFLMSTTKHSIEFMSFMIQVDDKKNKKKNMEFPTGFQLHITAWVLYSENNITSLQTRLKIKDKE